jgi:hypothetical protein
MPDDPTEAGTDTDDVSDLRAELDRLRRENDELRRRAEAVGAEPVGAAQPSRQRWRWAASTVLVVVASLLVPVSILAVWLDRTVTDTDRYVETVAPLARDPEIQKAVAARLERALFEAVDVEAEVRELLPERAAPLAAPITAGFRTLAGEVIDRVISSDQFAELWDRANRAAQQQVVDVLTNASGRKGVVEIDLTEVATEVSSRLEARGVPFASRLGDAPVTFEVFQSEEVAQVQQAFRLFERLATILPWVTLIVFAAAVLVAPDRRRGLLVASAGWVLGSLALLVAVAVGRSIYFDALPVGASLPANEAFFEIISRFLRGAGRTMLAVGVVVLVATLVAGPSRPAVGLRSSLSRLFGAAGGAADRRGLDLGPVGAFVARNLVALRVAVGVVAVLWFLALDQPSAGNVWWIAGSAVVALAALEVVGRTGVSPTAGADAPGA